MRIYACFDDTDVLGAPRGTGKLVRWFEDELPEGCALWGVVRQQLLVHPDVPYTSHNSSACAVIDAEDDPALVDAVIERAIAHLERHAIEGSDPGLCVARADDAAITPLMRFGLHAARVVTTQDAARAAAEGVHLSGHGGTNDGIIGAAAGVGLTAWGWSGRFVEYRGLRDWAPEEDVASLEDTGMLVVPVDRNVVMPKHGDVVETISWLRPRLWGGRPVVPVALVDEGRWRVLGKEPRGDDMDEAAPGA